jgi:molybdopterin-guanine dinucleotide biosynthesis protein A
MLTIAIHAGGRSERMGVEKAHLPLAGIPLIEHVLKRISGLGDELLITTNTPEKFAYLGIRTVPDLLPHSGAIIALHSALNAAQHKHVLSLACDMPFLNRKLIDHIINLSPNADVIVPFYKGEYEPFHAVYSRNCIAAIEKMLDLKLRRMVDIYDRVSVYKVGEKEISDIDLSDLSFFNINTREDLALAEQIYEQIRDENANFRE